MKRNRIQLHECVLGLCVLGLLLAAALQRGKTRVSLAAVHVAPAIGHVAPR